MSIRYVCASCIILLFDLAVVSNCYGQRMNVNTSIHASCTEKLQRIEEAYRSGQYAQMDSLFGSYLGSDCPKEEPENYRTVLTVVRMQRIGDWFRKAEADTLQKMIDSLTLVIRGKREKTDPYYSLRIGAGFAICFSSFGMPGWEAGVTAGYHPQGKNVWSLGYDAGIYTRRFPFEINAVRNKDATNNYIHNGYVLKTTGHITMTSIPIVFSMNIEPEEKGDIGISFFGGLELMMARSTYVKRFYYEYDYTDSSTGPNSRAVTYSTVDTSGYKNNSFFRKKEFLFLTFGGAFYWRPAKKLLLSFSPFYSYNFLNKLSVTNTSYSIQPNYGGIRLNAYFLLGMKNNR